MRGVANGLFCDALATCDSLTGLSGSSGSNDTAEDLAAEDIDAGWQALLADDLALLPGAFVEQLASRGLPVPTPGLDVLDSTGEASITLELAWESARVAIALEEDLPDTWQNSLADWQLITTLDDAAVDQLADWLSTTTRSEP